MPTYRAKTCRHILLYIDTNCNIVVFMTVCVCVYIYIYIYIYIYTCYSFVLLKVLFKIVISTKKKLKKQYPQVRAL